MSRGDADAPAGSELPRPQGYAQAASSGTRWATAQGLLNKLVAAAAMFLVAKALDPDEYGMASVVLVASSFAMVIPMYVMGDVLISHQHHLATVSRAATQVNIAATTLCAAIMFGTAPMIAAHYDKYPFGLMIALLLVCALRPIADAVSIPPLTTLRMALRYREIAMINGVCHLGQSIVTVVWALLWPSAAAIVVPQLLVVMLKAVFYAISVRKGKGALRRSVHRVQRRKPHLAARIRRRITREFAAASLAQYIHVIVGGLPVLFVSLFLSEDDVGQYGFAMTLAGQAVSIFSLQIGVVLQPIFSRLKTDPARQIRGFMRVLRVMTALTVPISLLQGALGEPVIRLVFDSKWIPSVPIFVAISVGQCAGFILAPVLALLKAQGRFTLSCLWQLSQAVVCALAFPMAAKLFGGAGVAWADQAIWLVSLVAAVQLGVRGAGVPLRSVLSAFALPCATSAPIAIGAWLAWRFMPTSPMVADLIAVIVIGPLALALSILAIRIGQPAVADEIAPGLGRVLRRLPIVGSALARWFAGRGASSECAR